MALYISHPIYLTVRDMATGAIISPKRHVSSVNSASAVTVPVKDTTSYKPGQFKVTSLAKSKTEMTSPSTDLVNKRFANPKWVLDEYSGALATHTNTINQCIYVESTTLMKSALQRAYAKIGKSELEMGVELGEFRETFKTLRSPLQSLRNFFSKDGGKNLRSLKEVIQFRSKPGRICKASGKTVADTWLEIRYGIMPIVRSIEGMIKYVEQQRVSLRYNTILSAKSKVVSTTEAASKLMLDRGFGPLEFRWKTKRQSTCRGQVYYRRFGAPGELDSLGLGFQFLPEIAWELTSCSFIMDWFVSVGDWIASHRYNPGIEILGATRSEKQLVDTTLMPIRVKDSTFHQDFSNTSGFTGRGEHYSRVVDVIKPPPLFLGAEKLDWAKLVDLYLIILKPLLFRR